MDQLLDILFSMGTGPLIEGGGGGVGDVIVMGTTLAENADPNRFLFVDAGAGPNGEDVINDAQQTYYDKTKGYSGFGLDSLDARVHIKGENSLSTKKAFRVDNAAGTAIQTIFNDGSIGFGIDSSLDAKYHFNDSASGSSTLNSFKVSTGGQANAFRVVNFGRSGINKSGALTVAGLEVENEVRATDSSGNYSNIFSNTFGNYMVFNRGSGIRMQFGYYGGGFANIDYENTRTLKISQINTSGAITTTVARYLSTGGAYIQKAPTTIVADGTLAANDITFYLDEAGNNLMVKAKYSDGSTVKSGTIALV